MLADTKMRPIAPTVVAIKSHTAGRAHRHATSPHSASGLLVPVTRCNGKAKNIPMNITNDKNHGFVK